MPFVLPPLYPILDSSFFPLEPGARAAYLSATVQQLAEAGVTLLQLRAKGVAIEQLLRDAETVRAAAHAYPHMRLMLNDYPELLAHTEFGGVHLGRRDMQISHARALLGAAAVVGLSTHTTQQVDQGSTTTADYLAIGPVFATASKADAEPAIGLEGVRAARAATRKPLVAIGGITLANVKSVWATGVDSVAVIGALFAGGRQPGTIAEDFLRLFR